MSEKVVESAVKARGETSSVLVGRFDHSLDPKKRLTIPREWRDALGSPEYVYVMADPNDKCLDLIPAVEMETRLEKLREQALFDPQLSRALQVIGSRSEQLSLDTQGRIRVSDKLLRFANLTTTVAMLGSVRTIKLWDPQSVPPEDEVDQAALGDALKLAGF